MNDDWAVLFAILAVPCLAFGFIIMLFSPPLGIIAALAFLTTAFVLSLGGD